MFRQQRVPAHECGRRPPKPSPHTAKESTQSSNFDVYPVGLHLHLVNKRNKKVSQKGKLKQEYFTPTISHRIPSESPTPLSISNPPEVLRPRTQSFGHMSLSHGLRRWRDACVRQAVALAEKNCHRFDTRRNYHGEWFTTPGSIPRSRHPSQSAIEACLFGSEFRWER